MAAAVPVPIPVPAEAVPAEAAAPMGELFSQYNPGAATDLFAPAYIRGFKPSEDAVSAWRAQNRSMTPQMLEQTRMPNSWVEPDSGVFPGGYGPYGAGRVPDNLAFLDSRGSVDPEALRVMAQGGQYDMGARRDAIAGRLNENWERRKAADISNLTNPWYVGPKVNMEQYDEKPKFFEYQND